jgi:hypothetical protein
MALDYLSILVRERYYSGKDRKVCTSAVTNFSCSRSDSDGSLQKMGYQSAVNHASLAKCDTTCSALHLSAEDDQSNGEGKAGQRIPAYDGSVDARQ